jgi:hypothetical protein
MSAETRVTNRFELPNYNFYFFHLSQDEIVS